jgi:acyl-CoA reductase-like NAD-dependent aldehyde dehydrogenase
MHATIEYLPVPKIDLHAKARAAQARWMLTPIDDRLRIVRKIRRLIAKNAETLAAASGAVSDRPLAEKLVSEILPLADACHWLERNAARVLTPRRCKRRGRPLWMRGLSFEVQRQPFGLVLVIGPRNYPLFLPAVHSLHALAAGNAVLLKPAPGTTHVAQIFAKLARNAGIDPALLTILPESIQAARETTAAGVDKVIFTGSSVNGRKVLADLANNNTPSVMELSGEDAVMVFADADLDLVVRALKFAARLNNGETCIAPRRLVVELAIADDLQRRLTLHGVVHLPLDAFEDEETAIDHVHSGSFALGVSIFSRNIMRAREIAARIKTGIVLINDLVVPTADPRMPFGGVKASGFGSTRGEEGLLEMTFPHVVALRAGNSHAHFDAPAADDVSFFLAYIRAAHGSWRQRFGAIRDLIGALVHKTKQRNINL